MKTSQMIVTLALAGMGSVEPAWATVDGFVRTTIITQDPQTEGYCYHPITTAAEVGIGLEAQTEGTLAPTFVYRNRPYAGPFAELTLIAGRPYVNINEISLGAPIEHTYIEDRYVNGVIEYEIALDTTALAAHNGSTLAGREKTIRQAKLALLAIARNLEGYPEPYRLFATFQGLPSQTGLSGTLLHATTHWPYTASSPLLAAYEAELIGADCPLVASGGKADYSAPLEADGPAGCSVSSPSSRSPWFLLLAGALLAGGLRRRG